MTVTTELNQAWEEKNQREEIFAARSILENMTNAVNEGLVNFKTVKAEGSFSTISQNLKDTLLAWEAMFDTFKASLISNDDIKNTYSWRP